MKHPGEQVSKSILALSVKMDVDELCDACIDGDYDRVCNLLGCLGEGEYDVVNVADEDDTTAVEYAIANGHLSILRLLHETYRSHLSVTHLLGAIQCGRVVIVGYLRSRGITYDRACVKVACEKGLYDVVRDAFTCSPLLFNDNEDQDEDTPLSLACFYGHLDVVTFLVNRCKVDIDARSGIALHSACNQGHVAVVEFLLRHGALPNIEMYDTFCECTYTPTDRASKHPKVARLFVCV